MGNCLMAAFGGGPKDLSKLPPGLRAYWEKKRKGDAKVDTDTNVATKKPKKATTKAKPKSVKKPVTRPISAKPAKKSRKSALNVKKSTNIKKREGGNDPRVVSKVVKARSAK